MGRSRPSPRKAFTPAAYASSTWRLAGSRDSYSRRAAPARSARRANTSKPTAAGPTTSAQRPVARRRSYSSWPRRSSAWTKPWAKKASRGLVAQACGMPHSSRRITTSSCRPDTRHSVALTVARYAAAPPPVVRIPIAVGSRSAEPLRTPRGDELTARRTRAGRVLTPSGRPSPRAPGRDARSPTAARGRAALGGAPVPSDGERRADGDDADDPGHGAHDVGAGGAVQGQVPYGVDDRRDGLMLREDL